jgi:hypothetical protein
MNDAPTLDEVLIALQKSFSRVSKQTARSTSDSPEKARALIVGEVNFEITIPVTPVTQVTSEVREVFAADVIAEPNDVNTNKPRFDKLRYQPEGNAISLKLCGTISTDIRMESGGNTSGDDSRNRGNQ